MPYKDREKQLSVLSSRYWANVEKNREEAKRRRDERRAIIWGRKTGAQCIRCGDSFHPAAMILCFPSTTQKVTIRIALAMKTDKLRNVVQYFEPWCANCHAIACYELDGSESK